MTHDVSRHCPVLHKCIMLPVPFKVLLVLVHSCLEAPTCLTDVLLLAPHLSTRHGVYDGVDVLFGTLLLYDIPNACPTGVHFGEFVAHSWKSFDWGRWNNNIRVGFSVLLRPIIVLALW